MPSAKDVKINASFFKVFVVGDSGTGKSIFASTFPKPAFLFDFDKSILSYRGLDVDYETYAHTSLGWVQFEKDFRGLKKSVKEGTFPYKTVIFDSTTTLSDMAMERAMQLDPKRSPTNGPLWNVHLGMVKNLLEGFIRQLLEFPCNVVVIGHLKRDYHDETGAVIGITPLLTGQLSTKVPSYFDEVYYAENKTRNGKTEFVLLTLAKGLLRARSRLSGREQLLPASIPNDYPTLIKYLEK